MNKERGWLRQERRSHTLWHATAYLAGLVALYWVLEALGPILTPVLAALGIAYLLDPMVTRLAHRITRKPATLLVLLGFALFSALGVAILLPLIAEDIEQFLPSIPILAERAVGWIQRTFKVSLPSTWRDVALHGGQELERIATDAMGVIGHFLALAMGGVFSFLATVLQLLLIPVFAFYLLVDWPVIVARVKELVPPRQRSYVIDLVRDMDKVVSSWVRGQLVVVAIEMVVYAAALSAVGIHLAIPIGILAGLLSFIPYVGAGLGLLLALVMALIDWHGAGRIVGVISVFAAMQVLDGLVLVPRLVGKKVGLGGAGALFAVLAGSNLLGFTGMMLAIPIAAASKVVLGRVLGYYQHTEFYSAPGSERTNDATDGIPGSDRS